MDEQTVWIGAAIFAAVIVGGLLYWYLNTDRGIASMTEETRRIVIRALDEAMAMAIINLFEVVNSDVSDESIERFEKGLRKTVDLHDQLVNTLKETGDG